MTNVLEKTIDRKILKQKIKGHESSQITQKCLSLDLYGKPVALTFQGRDKYRTKVGALITLFVLVFLLSFGLYRLIGRSDSEMIQQNSMHL